MPKTDEYILGTDREELDRLRFQHEAWVQQAHGLFEVAGLHAGQTVLDLGCGPGYTTLELATVVGAGGRVLAAEISPAFVQHLQSEVERIGLTNVETLLGPVEQLDLAPESIDAAYTRWLLCWLPDPGLVVERVARLLKPGGVFLLQEYFDWGAKKLVPRSALHDEIVSACMRSWPAGGATIDIGEELPRLAASHGLSVEHFEPVARMGRPGSLVWGWLGGFYQSYLPRLVERGLLSEDTRRAFSAEWQRMSAADDVRIYAPTVVNVVLRK
jgi:SAM-dependent methyltransferase